MIKVSNIQINWRQSISQYAPIFVLILCFLAILLLPFKPNITNKVFNIAGFISIITVLISPKKFFYNQVLIIAIPLFLIGISDFFWVELYKTSETIYRSVYHGHFQMGKIALFGSFILLTLAQCKNSKAIDKLHLFTAVAIPLIIFGYALYQELYQGISRVELSFGNSSNATGAAYAMIFLALYTQTIILQSKIKLRNYLYFTFILTTFISIILTQTRAAIFTFPIVMLIVFYLFLKQQKQLNKKLIVIPLIIILGCFFIFQKTIIERTSKAKKEIVSYVQNDRTSSVGDRLSMIKSGIYATGENLFWQSAEERNEKIAKLAKDDKSFLGATSHMHAHLHNDLIESLSTKGWLGGALLTLLLYLSIIIYAFKNNKNPFIFGFIISFIVLGLSDTLIFATQIPLSWILSLFLIINYTMKKQKD